MPGRERKMTKRGNEKLIEKDERDLNTYTHSNSPPPYIYIYIYIYNNAQTNIS